MKLNFKGEDPMDKNRHDKHGGPYDRGSADSYYGRGHNPHYYEGGTGTSAKIEQKDMTPDQISEYSAGYDRNEEIGSFKDWGDD